MSIGGLVATLLLLLANGFFVATEFALIASRRTKLETLAEDGNRSAQVALDAHRDLALQLAGVQLGVTMASLGIGYVAEPTIGGGIEAGLSALGLPASAATSAGFVLALAIVVLLHLVIGEMLPKSLTLADPEGAILLLAWPQRLYVAVFRPIIRVLNGLANAGVRLFGVEPKDDLATVASADEIAVMLANSRAEGLLAPSEHDLLSGALDFGDRDVASVMIPRDRVVTVRAVDLVRTIEAVVVERGHSRLPVIGSGPDDVLGFIHAKDLLKLPASARNRPYPTPSLRRMLILQGTTPLIEVLLRMQRLQLHLAIVVDDARRTIGLVTLEDVLESLVGAIRDESDREPDRHADPGHETVSTPTGVGGRP